MTDELLNASELGNATDDDQLQQQPPPSHFQYYVYVFAVYTTPLISFVGLVGNSVCLLGLHAMRPNSRVSVLLSASLIFVETVNLVVQLDRFASDVGYGIYGLVGGWCQFVTFVSQATDFLSVWYAASMAGDQAIRCIQRWSAISRIGTARVTVIGLAIVAIVVYVNIGITSGETHYEGRPPICMTLSVFDDVVRRLQTADAIVNSALPFVLMLTCLVTVAVRSCDSSRNRGNAMTSTKNHVTIDDQSEDVVGRNKDGDRCARILLVGFLVSHLPVHLFVDINAIRSWHVEAIEDPTSLLRLFLVQQILTKLKNIGQASNLFMLLPVSASFRNSLSSFIRKRKSCSLAGCCQNKPKPEFETDDAVI